MKRVLLIIAFTVLGSVQVVFSQVVINKVDFPLESSYETSSLLEYRSNLQPPTIGENQTWDLSDLNITHVINQEFLDASGDEFYTNATNYREAIYPLNDLVIESKDFYLADDQGYSRIGRRITEVVFPIAQITGGANDKLKINGGNIPFESRLDYVKFPLEYEKTWTEGFDRVTNFELTVESYGLNETPGVFISYISETRTVIGSGKLTIPNQDGGIMTIDALLIEVTNTEIDSVFLGGQPAPPQLMSAFNLTQGELTNDVFYVSYSALSSITTSVETDVMNSLSVYPNPVKSGSMLNISNSKLDLTNVVLVDQAGKVVLENQMNGKSNLSIPNSVSTGTYLLNSYDVNGTIISTNKIIIE